MRGISQSITRVFVDVVFPFSRPALIAFPFRFGRVVSSVKDSPFGSDFLDLELDLCRGWVEVRFMWPFCASGCCCDWRAGEMRTSTWISSILAVEDVPLCRFDLRAGCAAAPAPFPLPFMIFVSTLVLSCDVNLALLAVVVVVDLRRYCESSCNRENALDEGCIGPKAWVVCFGSWEANKKNKLGQPPGPP